MAITFITILYILLMPFSNVHADPVFRVAVTGDISCSSNGQNTVNQIISQNPSLVLWLGDLSYVDSDVNCFISETSQLASKDEAIVGNHDDSEDGTSAARTQLINHFGIPSTGYYSKTFDVSGTKRTNDVLLIGMDTQSSITTSSSQYKFVEDSLKNSNSPLKIIMLHKPFLSCTCEHSSNGQFNAYHGLFKKYGVDLVLQGHNHNIQYFNSIDNVKYIVSGAGGKSHYSLTSTPQPTHYRDDSNYGFTLIDADFATYQVQGKFITNGGTDKTASHFTQSFYQNSIPVADEQSLTATKNSDKTITLTGNDPDDDPLTYLIVTQPLHGTISTGTGASHIYTPAAGYAGPDSFTFKTNDGYIDSNTATVSIDVQNGPPVANDLTISVNKNTQKAITLTGTDPNGDPLSYSIVTPPAHGTISPTGTGGPSRTYSPSNSYMGSDMFTFKANDGMTDSSTAAVKINVIDAPQVSYSYAPSFVATGSNYQDTPDSASLRLVQFSVATWFKTSADFATDSIMVNKGGLGADSPGQNMNYGIWMTSAEKIRAGFETSAGVDQYVTSINSYNDGQWHYVIVTNDGTTLRLYIDGVEVATKALSGVAPENTGTKPVRLGANSRVTPPGNFFTGELDEVRVWNAGLTAQQVTSALGGTDFTTSKQVLYLDFTSFKPAKTNNSDPSIMILPG